MSLHVQVRSQPVRGVGDATSASSWKRIVFRQNTEGAGPDKVCSCVLERLPGAFVVGGMYTNLLQIVSMPECVLAEPGVYVMQFSDGHSFINAALNCAECKTSNVTGAGKRAWVFQFLREAKLFDLYYVQFFYCR